MSNEIPFTVCHEMQKLRDYLDEHNIVWRDCSTPEMSELRPVHWICRTHFDIEDKFYSVINGFATYGGYDDFHNKEDQGLLEIYGSEFDNPEGYKTAEDIISFLEGEHSFLRNDNGNEGE